MKNLFLFSALTILIIGCASSLKQLQRGDYETAIQTAVKELRKDPSNQEQIEVLDKAYVLANQQDYDRIKFLKEEGSPSNWDEIFERYLKLKNRQALVHTVLPLQLADQIIDYDFIDYDAEIIQSKRKAGDYYWRHANELMRKGDKQSYREAYFEFGKAKEFFGNIQNINQLMEEAREKGISRILVSFKNKSPFNLPANFVNDLMTFGASDLNSMWHEFYLTPQTGLRFDYMTVVGLTKIEVSPEQTKQRDRTETKEIEDGWDYLLDDNGNVVKDSQGNDIKIPRKRTISCTLIETLQYKVAQLVGDIELIQNNPKKTVKQVPIGAESVFQHVSARAIGDVNALSNESRASLKNKPVQYPRDIDLIVAGSENLKKSIRQGIGNLRSLIK